MGSNTWTRTASASPSAPSTAATFDRGAAVTRSLLGYGVIVGPFYLAVGIGQGLLRDGFDFGRHALSHLANGPGGWVQIANFVLSGLMVIAAAIGIARVLKVRAPSGFLAAFGASMLVASVFRADPVDGFPPGTPAGVPTTMSTSGIVHFAAGGIGFLSLAIACIAMAVAMKRRAQRSMMWLSLLSGIAVIVGFFSPMFLPIASAAVAGIWFSVVVGWAWLAITSVHLYRASPSPNCAPQEA
jgi:hypothetical membrane protein